MTFPVGNTQPPATTPPPGSPPPPPPAAEASPPPPATPQLPDMHMNQNGQPVAATGAQLASMPDETQVYYQEAWTTLGQVRATLGMPPMIPSSPPAPQQAAGPPQTYGTPHQQQRPTGSPFAGVETAEIGFKRLPYLEGHPQGFTYLVEVLEIKFQAGRNGDFVFLEVEIIQSSYNQANPETLAANQPGTRASIGLKKNDSFASNMKELVIALTPPDAQGNWRPDNDMVTQAECDELVSEAQPAKGRLLKITATVVKTRAGGDFTRPNFYPAVKMPDGTIRMQ